MHAVRRKTDTGSVSSSAKVEANAKGARQPDKHCNASWEIRRAALLAGYESGDQVSKLTPYASILAPTDRHTYTHTSQLQSVARLNTRSKQEEDGCVSFKHLKTPER
eukprot:scpid38393/ scgid21725/ 